MAVAHPGMVCGPALRLRVRSDPLTNKGASLTGLTAIADVIALVLNAVVPPVTEALTPFVPLATPLLPSHARNVIFGSFPGVL